MEKGCYVEHTEEILYKDGCADFQVNVQVNGKSRRILESGRVCLCNGDLCNENDEEGNDTPQILSQNSSEHQSFQKPGTDISPHVIPGQSNQ